MEGFSFIPLSESGGDNDGDQHGDQIPAREEKRSYSVFRMVLLVSAVSSTEFCYAAEIVFVTPLLLEIGLPDRYGTMMWTMSPLLGLLLQTPLGQASDNCRCSWGRRRPFIVALAGISALGVVLVPNGKILGEKLGDSETHRPWAIALTVLGLVLMDTCLDSMLSPLRAVLLDVTETRYHALGNNLFAVSTGVGASIGFAVGGIEWTSWVWQSSPLTDEQITFLLALIYLILTVSLSCCSITERKFDGHDGQSENIVIRYAKTMWHTPSDLRLLAVYSCFGYIGWLSSYLFFTDFVGQAVYVGDPSAPEGSHKLALYHKGVHMGSWGLCIYGISTALFGVCLKKLTATLGDRFVFVSMNTVFFVGCGVMIVTPSIYVVLPMASVLGVMYVALSSFPFNLLSQYHERYQVCYTL